VIAGVASFCLALLVGCVFLNLYRVIKGPSMADRVVAADVIFVDLIAIVVVYSVILGTSSYFDLALVFSLLGFVATVAFAKFLARGRIVE